MRTSTEPATLNYTILKHEIVLLPSTLGNLNKSRPLNRSLKQSDLGNIILHCRCDMIFDKPIKHIDMFERSCYVLFI